MAFRITNGPSKYHLMLALFDRSMNNPRPVEFTVQAEPDARSRVPFSSVNKLVVAIHGVSIEDGSGESFCFEAHGHDGKWYKGWFRTDDRHGTIEEWNRNR